MKFNLHLSALILFFLAPMLLSAQSTPASSSPAVTSTESLADLAPPEHPATPEQVREYLALTNYVANAHNMIVKMLNASRLTSAPYYTASFWDDMSEAVLKIDMVTPTIPAYQKYFSQEDMATLIAFYKTPAGQRFLVAQPFIVSSAGDVLRKAGQAAGMQVGLKHKDEIEALMKKYGSQTTTPATPKQ